MAKKVKFLPKARADLKNIYRYTKKNWGLAQAESYSRQLNSVFQKLANNQLKGQNANNIRDGLRRQHSGSHVIFFQINGDKLIIAAILHKSMDYIKHL